MREAALPRRRPLGRRLTPYLLAAPAALLILGLVAALAVLAVSSFKAEGGWGWGQYRRILETPDYLRHFGRSAWFALVATAIAVVLGYPVALYLQAARPRLRKGLLAFLVLVFFSDYVLRMFGLVLVLGNNGLINRALQWAGLTDAPVRLMYNETGVIVGLVMGSLPFTIFAISSVLGRIDRATIEAARLLGASPARVFRHVILPLSMPGAIAGAVIVFLLSLNSYITPALLGGGFAEMIANFIYEQALGLANLPLGAAAAFVLFAGSMALLALVNFLVARHGRRFGARQA